jgi:hypothetical protein
VRLEGLAKLKNPVTSSGIEPATFRLVAQCLNLLRYRVPSIITNPLENHYEASSYVNKFRTLSASTIFPFPVPQFTYYPGEHVALQRLYTISQQWDG